MGLGRKQFWSIFLALIMVGSVLGYFSLSGQDNSPTVPPEGTVPSLPPEQATTVSYDASGIQSKVLTVFPVAVLVGTTSEFETASVVSQVSALEGVVSVANAQFVEPQPGQAENFRADIRFSDTSKIPGAVQAITELSSFSSVQIFPQALITVPQKVEFKNAGLDLVQEYSFADPQTQAYILPGTMEGDELMISISAQFQGQQLAGMIAFEEQNLTSSPQLYSLQDSFTVSSLENDFFLRGTVPLSENGKLESVKAFFGANPDYNASIQIAPASNALTIIFAEPSRVFPADLNVFLSSFEGVDSFQIEQDAGSATVNFAPDENFVQFRDSLRQELDSLLFTVKEIQEPNASLQGTVSSEGKEALLETVAKVSKDNSVELEVLQLATIDANSVFVPDANASFTLAQGFFGAFVKPGHSVGDSVELSILMFASQRGGISDIQAQEAGAENGGTAQ